MKHVRRFFLFILLFCIGIIVVNTKTDFFYNISVYIPALEQHHLAVQMISDASQSLSELTASIPTPSEIYAMITHKELPIDPSDVAQNAYIANSPMLSFYPRENISVMMDESGKEVQVFGIVGDASKRHLIVNFSDSAENQLGQTQVGTDTAGQFNKFIKIPETDENRLEMVVFAGAKEYGQFASWVLNLVHLVRDENGLWSLETSPVYEANKAMYEKDRSLSEALKSTPSIQSTNNSIISIAQQLTATCDNDYDKAVALHDWICSYLYYDEDGLNSDTTIPFYATEVVANRKAVCLGFATLYAALCRSLNIPCYVVSGYALGIGDDTEWNGENTYTDFQNHAWNEVYVDGRWVIVDTTWDCQNKFENGQNVDGDSISHLYFDSNLQYFSQNHKILEYAKRR